LTRWPGCSRTNSRRIEAPLALAALLAILPACAARAQQDLRISLEGARVVVSLAYSDPRAGEVLASLGDGLAAEIQFQLRLYRRQRGFFAFLGDRLAAEQRLVLTARYDRFEECYRVQGSGSVEARFAEARDFLDSFFSLGPLVLGELSAGGFSEYYVQSRVRLTPVKIVQPLRLITLFYPQQSSPWLRKELRPSGPEVLPR
jgi:hypothetical protein